MSTGALKSRAAGTTVVMSTGLRVVRALMRLWWRQGWVGRRHVENGGGVDVDGGDGTDRLDNGGMGPWEMHSKLKLSTMSMGVPFVLPQCLWSSALASVPVKHTPG